MHASGNRVLNLGCVLARVPWRAPALALGLQQLQAQAPLLAMAMAEAQALALGVDQVQGPAPEQALELAPKQAEVLVVAASCAQVLAPEGSQVPVQDGPWVLAQVRGWAWVPKLASSARVPLPPSSGGLLATSASCARALPGQPAASAAATTAAEHLRVVARLMPLAMNG